MRPMIGSLILVCIGYAGPHGEAVDTPEEGKPVLRPATVTRVWSDDCVNAQLHLDGSNDRRHACDRKTAGRSTEPGCIAIEDCERGSKWLTSSCRGDGIGHWRWSEALETAVDLVQGLEKRVAALEARAEPAIPPASANPTEVVDQERAGRLGLRDPAPKKRKTAVEPS